MTCIMAFALILDLLSDLLATFLFIQVVLKHE